MIEITKKFLLIICLFSILLFSLSSCSPSDKLSGKYISESGDYSVEFKSDGTCRWYQKLLDTETFFDGTYEKSGETYTLFVNGVGVLVLNTIFTAEIVEDGLKITGGTVNGEIFKKQ